MIGPPQVLRGVTSVALPSTVIVTDVPMAPLFPAAGAVPVTVPGSQKVDESTLDTRCRAFVAENHATEQPQAVGAGERELTATPHGPTSAARVRKVSPISAIFEPVYGVRFSRGRSPLTAATRHAAGSGSSPRLWTRSDDQPLSCPSVALASFFSQSSTSLSAGGFLSWSYEVK